MNTDMSDFAASLTSTPAGYTSSDSMLIKALGTATNKTPAVSAQHSEVSILSAAVEGYVGEDDPDSYLLPDGEATVGGRVASYDPSASSDFNTGTIFSK